MTTATSDALAIGKKLAEYFKQGQFVEAIQELFSDDAQSIEPENCPDQKNRIISGKEAMIGKNNWWAENHEIHGMGFKGPFPHDERIAFLLSIDVTAKTGPMAGQRMEMEEICIYTIADGKIVKEEFFYGMP